MFVFTPHSGRHPLDNTSKIAMLGHQNGRLQITQQKGVGYAGLLPEVSHQAGDAEPSTGDPEERPASHTGRLPGMWHQDVPDRQGIVSAGSGHPAIREAFTSRQGEAVVSLLRRRTQRRLPGQRTLAWLSFCGDEASPLLL